MRPARPQLQLGSTLSMAGSPRWSMLGLLSQSVHGRALSSGVLAGCVPVDAQLPGICSYGWARSLAAVPPSTLPSVAVEGFLRGAAVGLRTLPLSPRVASTAESTSMSAGPERQCHPSSTAPVRRAPSYAHLRLYRASRPLGITKRNPEEQGPGGRSMPLPAPLVASLRPRQCGMRIRLQVQNESESEGS